MKLQMLMRSGHSTGWEPWELWELWELVQSLRVERQDTSVITPSGRWDLLYLFIFLKKKHVHVDP